MMKTTIIVPEPCNQSWSAMSIRNNGRFCDQCKKVVVDFSEMSKSEINEYVSNHPEVNCGNFTVEQLLEGPTDTHSFTGSRSWYFQLMASLFMIFLTVKLPATTPFFQQTNPIEIITESNPDKNNDEPTIIKITGKVKDSYSRRNQKDVEIRILGTDIVTYTNWRGEFELVFTAEPGSTIQLKFKAEHFDDKAVTLTNIASQDVYVLLHNRGIRGEFIMSNDVIITTE